MFIELNESEQMLARHIAERRWTTSREAGLVNPQQGRKMTEQEMDLEGAGAELAFCKVANVYPDMEMTHTNQVDAYTRNGERIDVKATRHERGRLLAVRWKKAGKVDFFVLMVGAFPKYRCAGFYPSEKLLQTAMLQPVGNGMAYAANQDDLQRIEDLLG
jgi:hypothetical protein